MSNVNPPPTVTTVQAVHPATQATVGISAVLAFVLYALQTFGFINSTQATNIQSIVTEVAADLGPILTPIIQDAIKQNLPAPIAPVVITPKTDPATTPVVDPAADLKAELAKLAAQLTQLQTTVVTKPIVDPTKPIAVPVGPAATIVTQDSKGKPLPVDTSKLFSTAEPAKQFLMLSTGTTHAGKATSLNWTLLKSSEDDIDANPIPSSDGNGNSTAGYSVTMRNQSTLTVMLSATQDNVISATSLIVKCGTAPQPPPAVTVVPVQPVNPAPAPIVNVQPAKTLQSKDMRVLIVYDARQNHKPAELTILNSTKFVAAARTRKCLKDGTQPAWRRWSVTTDASKDPDPALQAMWTETLPKAQAKGLPAIAVACGDTITITPITSNGTTLSEADAIGLLTCGG